jgi:cell wall assembly regulator SMI1
MSLAFVFGSGYTSLDPLGGSGGQQKLSFTEAGATRMKDVWKRIHDWLAANAPAGYGQLRPGARVEAIGAAEDAMGVKLPDDIKASYGIHDGQANEPGLIGGEGWCLLPLKEIVEQWGRWSRSDPRDARCVPVAWGGTGDYVFLNFDPHIGEPGCLMIQRSDSVDPDPLVPSFSAWLAGFADQLENGEFAYSEEDGCLMYADELDLD